MATTQTLTLTEFLLARIAEDQAVASANTDHFEYPRWDVWSVERRGERAVLIRQAAPGARKSGRLDVHHTNIQMLDQFARWDPARVLAECEAKRRIVESQTRLYPEGKSPATEVLRLLALPYADHADYREAWRP